MAMTPDPPTLAARLSDDVLWSAWSAGMLTAGEPGPIKQTVTAAMRAVLVAALTPEVLEAPSEHYAQAASGYDPQYLSQTPLVDGRKAFGAGICARCLRPAPPGCVVCDSCQSIADIFNASMRHHALTPEPVTPPPSAPPDDATLIRAALAGDYADTGTTLPGVSPADRWMDHVTREIGPAQQAWAARAAANRCEAMRRVLAGDPRDPQAIADEIAPRVSWTGVSQRARQTGSARAANDTTTGRRPRGADTLMPWTYRVIRRVEAHHTTTEPVCTICEVYTTADGTMVTKDPIWPCGTDAVELRADIERMAKACELPVLEDGPNDTLREYREEPPRGVAETESQTTGVPLMNTPVDAAALAATVAQMTPGPWSWESIAEKSNEFAVGTAFDADGQQLAGQLPPDQHIEDAVIERRNLVGMNESGHASFADAAGIVALVNAAPALIQMARTCNDVLKLAREAANGWAAHARRDSELKEIGRIHQALDALAALDAAREE